MRGGERGRVVEAVADHQHLAALGLRAPRGGRSCRPAVAPAHPAAMPASDAAASTTAARSPDSSSVCEAGLVQARDDVGRIGPQPVLEGEGDRAAARRRYQTVAVSPCRHLGAAPGGRAEALGAVGTGALQARARHLAHVGDRASHGESRGLGRAHHGAGIGMPARGREGCRAGEHVVADGAAPADSDGSPSVSVPVLSNTTVSISASRSSPSAALTRTPLPNSRLAAATCTAGTASASAQGQVMISTAMAAVSAALPAVPGDEPAEEGGEPEDVHGRRIEARGAVGEPHVAPARLLGRRHQAGDLGEQRVLVGGGRLA